jgi:uncharacterized cupredoxin-like copper-binding protein
MSALSTMTFHPGTYKFVAVNKGQASHNLVISGPGANQAKTPDLISPGETEPVTVTLQKGTYDIYCGVPGHKANRWHRPSQDGGAADLLHRRAGGPAIARG